MPAMVTSGESCGVCECPCAYDFSLECYVSGPCANPMCPSYIAECILFKDFKCDGFTRDPNAWGHEPIVDISTRGLMRNLAPHYWPVRLELPKYSLMSFDQLMVIEREKELTMMDASVGLEAQQKTERVVETNEPLKIKEPLVRKFLVKTAKGPSPDAKSRFRLVTPKSTRGPYKKKKLVVRRN